MANTQQVETNTGRHIGKWGTASRLVLGGLFIYWALLQGVGSADAVIGLVVFPAAVSVVLALRGRDAPPLRLGGREATPSTSSYGL